MTFEIGAGQRHLEGPTVYLETTLEKRELGFDTDILALKYRKDDGTFINLAQGADVILADGSVPFVAPISGVTPIAASHLTTKSYVDALIQGLDWQESILDFLDFTTAEPPAPNNGDRYIATVTGNGNVTAVAVIIDNIYEWNGASWDETVPNIGFTALIENLSIAYTYNGTSWVIFGAISNHNSLTGLQGGNGSSEYYHLDLTQFNALHDAVTVTAVPLTLSGQNITFNYNTSDFDIAGSSLELKGDVIRSDGSVSFVAAQQGVTPVGPTDLVTKAYADGLSGAPGGAATNIQFNTASTLDGNAGLVYNQSSGKEFLLTDIGGTSNFISLTADSDISIDLFNTTGTETLSLHIESNIQKLTANSVSNLLITNAGTGSVALNDVVLDATGSTSNFLNQAGGYITPPSTGIGGTALPYLFNTSITPAPPSGQLHYDDATQLSAGKLFIHETTNDSGVVENILNNWEVDSHIVIGSDGDSSKIQTWQITAKTDQANYVEFDITLVFSNGGNFASGEGLIVLNTNPVLIQSLYEGSDSTKQRLLATATGLDSSPINFVAYTDRISNGFPAGNIFMTADTWNVELDDTHNVFRIGTTTVGTGKSMIFGNIGSGALDLIELTSNSVIITNDATIQDDLFSLTPAGPRSYRYRFSTATAGTPANDFFRFDNITQSSVTKIVLNEQPLDKPLDVALLLDSVKVGSTIYIVDADYASRYMSFTVDVVTPQAGATEYEITIIDQLGSDLLNNNTYHVYLVDASAGGGGGTWISLSDTPNSFTGQEGKIPIVNTTTNALELNSLGEYSVLFEDWSDGDGSTNGWVFVNDGTNDWIVGSADALSGGFSGYISSNGTNNTYNTGVAQVSFMYVQFNFVSHATDLIIDFDWICQGENSTPRNNFDFGAVFLANTSFTPTAGVFPTESGNVVQIGKVKYIDKGSLQSESFKISDKDLRNFRSVPCRLIFCFKNDNSTGTQPPFNVDNIQIRTRVVPSESMKSYVFNGTSVELPNNSDWDTALPAGIAQDTINNALTVMRFSDSVEEGVGFTVDIPKNATTLSFAIDHRAQTTPGSNQTIQMMLKHRKVSSGAPTAWGIELWRTTTVLNNSTWQLDDESDNLNYFGITPGERYQFEITRDGSEVSDTLSGDWTVQNIIVRFK